MVNQNKESGNRQKRRAHDSGRSTKRQRNVFASAFASIGEAQDSMQDLLDRLVDIDSIEPITVQHLSWNNGRHPDIDYGAWKERISIFREAGEFFDALVRSVDKGLLSPSRKHGKELSQLAECLLYICSQQPMYQSFDEDTLALDTDEILGAIREVLNTLEVDWNLDVSHRHYEQAIAAACNLHEWKFAADLFEKQIDPNAGGSPVQVSIENPLGLFAMAQHYQHDHLVSQDRNEMEQDSMVAEQIMDAVQRLVMVSPQDQKTYVLAAGNALGHSGYWKELYDFRKSSFFSDRYGTQLIAAVLRACILCQEYEAALEILVEENILSPSLLPIPAIEMDDTQDDPFATTSTNDFKLEEEWQWGGARDRMDPLIRDLAMQVVGGAAAMSSSNSNEGELDRKIFDYCDSRLALDLFRQSLEEGVTISQDALLGVVETCERDKDWRGALGVLRTILAEEETNKETSNLAPWIVSSHSLSIVERDQVEDNASMYASSTLADLGPIVASVMRNCNSSSNFGLSLFALQLLQTQMLRSTNDSTDNQPMSPEEGIAKLLNSMSTKNISNHCDEILVASMVALCGLRCSKNAKHLYEIASRSMDRDSSAASFVYEYVSTNEKRYGTLLLSNPWLSAHGHIEKLFIAHDLTRTMSRQQNGNGGTEDLNPRQKDGLEELLARAMQSCTSAYQPELSLYLLGWMEDSIHATPKDAQSFWKHHETNGSNQKTRTYGDSVTAEIILAHRWTKNIPRAMEIFEEVLETHSQDDLVEWRNAIGAGLVAMVADGRGPDACEVFGVLDDNAKSPNAYNTIGRHLAKVGEWKELIDLYQDANKEGYHSEELGLLAMKAVTSTKVDNRLKVLRTIVESSSSSVGLDSKDWTKAKYWQLKRRIGFHYARLLMWWNDPDRAPLDEVNLAIKEFHKETSSALQPKHEVIRAIVVGAQLHDQLGLETQDGYEKVPRTPEDWTKLLGTILHSIRDSSIRFDPNFVDSLVRAYYSLGKGNDCLDYVEDSLQMQETRLRQTTLEMVLEIAQAEQNAAMCHDIEMLLSKGIPSASTN